MKYRATFIPSKIKVQYLFTAFLFCMMLQGNLFAQAPNRISYQAVMTDNADSPILNATVGIKISVLQGSAMGTPVYVETHTTTTNGNGLISIQIGNGTPLLGTIAGVNWATGPYFVKTETDPNGGTSYTIIGTSELLSVPYALYSVNGTPGPQGTTGATGAAGQGGVTTAGSGINVTGVGTVASPYVVSATKPCGLAIGQTYQGGIIFYLDASGCHGLISAPTDQSNSATWSNVNVSYTDTYASGSGLFDGDGNCYRIRRTQGDCASCNAAEICLDFSIGVYSDWYLPSKYELNLMYTNIGQGNALGLGNVGGFANNYYWSSTEFDNFYAWYQRFSNGFQNYVTKYTTFYVRAVRAF